MSLGETVSCNRTAILGLTALFVGLGAMAAASMPLSIFPEVAFHRISVIARAGELPVEQRAVVHLKLWEEMTFEAIAKALVDHPEQVQVRSVDGEQVTVLELRVHPEDLGKVIGRQGRTAKSIRTILGAAGMKIRKRLTLEILE